MKREYKNKAVLICMGLIGLALVGLSIFVLKKDAWSFWIFYLMALVLGAAWMPVTSKLFASFRDKGWFFSKILAIAVSGFLVWFLVAVRILLFSMATCVAVTVLLCAGCVVFYVKGREKNPPVFPEEHLVQVFAEELLFIGVFLLWTYLAGFHPAAYGTEKFMDYGFMEAMMRSTTLPAADMWYGTEPINYYYGGQYFAVFLTKLTGTRVEITYNLMRTFVAAFAFILPFSLVFQMVCDSLENRVKRPVLVSGGAGVLGGLAVSIAGNMHYVIYGSIIPLMQKLKGEEVSGYWFPDATRYIGFNPPVDNDRTIHEFPCYSFVLGDLHAHVVNIMFVLFLIGLLYAYLKQERQSMEEDPRGKSFWLRFLLKPHILLAGFFLGMFQWTNFWDFVIYFVVTGAAVLFANILRFKKSALRVIVGTILQALEYGAVAMLVILPFTLQFKAMVSGVRLAAHHTMPYQMLVLWGLPGALAVILMISIIVESVSLLRKRRMEAAAQAAIPETGGSAEEAEHAGPEKDSAEKNNAGKGKSAGQRNDAIEKNNAGKGKSAGQGSDTVEKSTAERENSAGPEEKPGSKEKGLARLMDTAGSPDLFVIITALCAIGLVIIPEVVYVHDIYEATSARANTMFKLTYQAFILFGITMGYGLARLFFVSRRMVYRVIAVAGTVLLLWTVGYFGEACHDWFGKSLTPANNKGLNALCYLETDFPDDAPAIRWLRENVKDVKMVLEANGDSYTGFERVSAATGLPTVLGWYVHEWLWRNDTGDLNAKGEEIKKIYTSGDAAVVRSLLAKYDVDYIFVGSKEKEKYGETLSSGLLQSLGTIVFLDNNSGTFIVKV